MNTTSILKTLSVAAIAGTISIMSAAQAGTLENMERERAILLDALLSAELEPAKAPAKDRNVPQPA